MFIDSWKFTSKTPNFKIVCFTEVHVVTNRVGFFDYFKYLSSISKLSYYSNWAFQTYAVRVISFLQSKSVSVSL